MGLKPQRFVSGCTTEHLTLGTIQSFWHISMPSGSGAGDSNANPGHSMKKSNGFAKMVGKFWVIIVSCSTLLGVFSGEG